MTVKTKRWTKILIFIAILSLAATFCSATLFAAEKYLVSEGTHIDITLNSDGSAVIEEAWSYYYGGDSITRMGRLYLEGDHILSDFEVYLDGDELTVLDAPSEERPLGFAAVYRQEDGSIKVDTYLNALGESHQVTIKYVVQNAVTVYNDVADFTWNLTSNAEPASISTLTADIHIPYGTEDGGLLYWAHGPSGGAIYSVVDDSGMVELLSLSAEDIPTTTAVAIRLAMPTELFPEVLHAVNEEKLGEIIEFEMQYERQNTSKATEDRLMSGAVYPVIAGAVLFVLVILMKKTVMDRKLKKLRFKLQDSPRYYRALPDELSPALVQRLMSVYPQENKGVVSDADGRFSVTVLDLVERGAIQVSNDSGETALSIDKSKCDRLEDYEKDVISIFETASQGQSTFTLDTVSDHIKNNVPWMREMKAAFNEHFGNAWDALRLEQPKKESSFPMGRFFIGAVVGGMAIFGILTLIFRDSLIFAGNAAFFLGALAAYGASMLALAFGVALLITNFSEKPSVLTESGERRYVLWQAFGRFLDDLSILKELEFTDIDLWRKYLVYAAALGRGKKVRDQLQIVCPPVFAEVYERNAHYYWYDDFLNRPEWAAMNGERGYSLNAEGYDGGSGGDFSSDAGGYDSGSGGGDFD